MTTSTAPRRRTWTAAAALLAAAALAAGCGGGKLPPRHYYRLAFDATESPPAAPEGLPRLEVGVPAFLVDPPYGQESLVFRGGRDSMEVGFYNDHRWAAPLSRMLAAMLADHLMEAAGGFVLAGPPAGRPLDARLEGRLMALEEMATPEGPVARARMRLTLRALDGETLWSRTVEGEAAVEAMEPGAVPRAMHQAILEALRPARAALTGVLLRLARGEDRPGDGP